MKTGNCVICGNERPLTKHHVRPKSVRNQFVKIRKGPHIELICRPCHDVVHQKFSNVTLGAISWVKLKGCVIGEVRRMENEKKWAAAYEASLHPGKLACMKKPQGR